jgi:exodeoxyribonuclease V gamma subunit
VTAHYSKLGPGHRLQSWVRLLALAASDEDRSWTAHTLGRAGRGALFSVSSVGPLDHRARSLLTDLVTWRDHGLTAPLPLPIKTSNAYASARRTQADVSEAQRRAARSCWYDDDFPGEQSAEPQVRAWGRGAGLPGLDEAPWAGEESDGETTRFGALSMRLWTPLFLSEQGSI